ncbi:alpha/beta-hydrolase [Xylariaceae sp. FL0662B]|nr:alpha/beta-hydrolase [Xylariaceae sp. FL0662B]
MDGALTTANVPVQYLGDLGLVGSAPLTALQVDPRISYALYVPESHYNPNPSASFNFTVDKLPILVYIHATGRNYFTVYDELASFADSARCAVLAPVFPAGIDGPNDSDSYKVLRSPSLRSDLGLLSILDQVAYRWPGIEIEKVFMMGFSGGGQFAHRFLYLYPERLAAVSIGAPGTITFLDSRQSWPAGIKDVKELFNKTVSTALIGNVPIQLVVGDEDNKVDGSPGFAEWYQEAVGDGVVLLQEGPRLDGAKRLHASWEKAGIRSRLDIVAGVGHQEAGVRETVLKFLQPWIQKGV